MLRKPIHVSKLLFFVLFQRNIFVHGHEFANVVEEDLKFSKENFVNSYTTFHNNIVNFLEYPFKKMEKDRMKLKSAFKKFWEQLTAPDSQKAQESPYNVQPDLRADEDELSDSEVLDTEDLVKLHGFKAETHTVNTRDGYILTIFRVLQVNDDGSQLSTKIALLFHGLLGSSSDWVLLGPSKALPYMLVESGYEVWLANARGNVYSREHEVLNVESTQFWNFSFHEIGCYDLPATFDYIQIASGSNSKIDFIGHSMGATALLVLLASEPQYNHVLKSAILMAPLAIMNNVKGPLKLLSEFAFENGINSLNFLGRGMFLSNGLLPSMISKKYCVGDKLLCLNPWLLMANGGINVNPALKTSIMDIVPSDTSLKTILHYAQLVISGKFEKYYLKSFYESKIKINVHKTAIEEYSFDNIVVPITLFSAKNDWLAPSDDVTSLLSKLPNCEAHYIVRRSNFTHLDFLWSDEIDTKFYSVVLNILKR